MKKMLLVFLVLLAFALGMYIQRWIYTDRCLDMGGGANPGGYPFCVVEKYGISDYTIFENIDKYESNTPMYYDTEGHRSFAILSKGMTKDSLATILLKDISTGLRYYMTHTPSGSGAKYEDANGNFFWTKGESFMVGNGDIIYSSNEGVVANSESRFEGYFTYYADAARFESCDKVLNVSVSQQNSYLELERKYLNLQMGGKPAYVILEGKVISEEGMEGDMIDALVIDKVIHLDPKKACK